MALRSDRFWQVLNELLREEGALEPEAGLWLWKISAEKNFCLEMYHAVGCGHGQVEILGVKLLLDCKCYRKGSGVVRGGRQ